MTGRLAADARSPFGVKWHAPLTQLPRRITVHAMNRTGRKMTASKTIMRKRIVSGSLVPMR